MQISVVTAANKPWQLLTKLTDAHIFGIYGERWRLQPKNVKIKNFEWKNNVFNYMVKILLQYNDIPSV